MGNSETRLSGKIISIHPSKCKYGGSFGEILGDDGEYYVWDSGMMFRNGTSPHLNEEYTFEVLKGCVNHYANRIDLVKKRGFFGGKKNEDKQE